MYGIAAYDNHPCVSERNREAFFEKTEKVIALTPPLELADWTAIYYLRCHDQNVPAVSNSSSDYSMLSGHARQEITAS
jgi:hypothetical protein